jgi:hypothetical protein
MSGLDQHGHALQLIHHSLLTVSTVPIKSQYLDLSVSNSILTIALTRRGAAHCPSPAMTPTASARTMA